MFAVKRLPTFLASADDISIVCPIVRFSHISRVFLPPGRHAAAVFFFAGIIHNQRNRSELEIDFVVSNEAEDVNPKPG